MIIHRRTRKPSVWEALITFSQEPMQEDFTYLLDIVGERYVRTPHGSTRQRMTLEVFSKIKGMRLCFHGEIRQARHDKHLYLEGDLIFFFKATRYPLPESAETFFLALEKHLRESTGRRVSVHVKHTEIKESE